MKIIHLILIAIFSIAIIGCNKQSSNSTNEITKVKEIKQAKEFSGTVLETMNTAGYTYLKVKTSTEEIWAAAPEFKVSVGNSVIVPSGLPMVNYHSKTLNRDFKLVYFVGDVKVLKSK